MPREGSKNVLGMPIHCHSLTRTIVNYPDRTSLAVVREMWHVSIVLHNIRVCTQIFVVPTAEHSRSVILVSLAGLSHIKYLPTTIRYSMFYHTRKKNTIVELSVQPRVLDDICSARKSASRKYRILYTICLHSTIQYSRRKRIGNAADNQLKRRTIIIITIIVMIEIKIGYALSQAFIPTQTLRNTCKPILSGIIFTKRGHIPFTHSYNNLVASQ